MSSSKDDIKIIFKDLSPKEEAMYDAVIEMLEENQHFSRIKVSDITKRAGIGKGTAYEYFTSKEEILIKALLFDAYKSMKEVEEYLKGTENFRDKFYWLMDFIEKNVYKIYTINELLILKGGKLYQFDQLRGTSCEENREIFLHYVNSIADYYVKQGVEEGIFTEIIPGCGRNTLYTQVMGYMIMIMTDYYNQTVSRETARDFAYASLLKSLS